MRTIRFRVSPAPSTALPFGVRSCGHYVLTQEHAIDRTAERPFVQLYWGISGAVTFGFASGDCVLHAGEVIVYAKDSRHLVTAQAGGGSYRWATFDGPLADPIMAAFGLVPPWPRQAGPAPTALFEELDRLLAHPGVVAERQATAVGWSLMAAAAAATPDEDPLIAQVQERLLQGLADPELSIEAIADQLQIDRSVLTRRFTAAEGLAPKPYLQSLRLNRAMSLLAASDDPIQRIALDCGFTTGNYFARVFKAATGETPETFRRNVR